MPLVTSGCGSMDCPPKKHDGPDHLGLCPGLRPDELREWLQGRLRQSRRRGGGGAAQLLLLLMMLVLLFPLLLLVLVVVVEESSGGCSLIL